MADIGTDRRVVRIRLLGVQELVEPQAEKLVTFLEAGGYTVLEWTKPYPCRAPEEDKVRVYLTARKE